MGRILEIVLLAVGQGCERLHERPQRNRRVAAVPSRREDAAGMGVEQEEKNAAAGEVAVQRFCGGLRKQA